MSLRWIRERREFAQNALRERRLIDAIGEGTEGPPGPAGVGVPTGGNANQVLKKLSTSDHDTGWADDAGGGAGIPEAPIDANQYVRSNGAWVPLSDGGADMIIDGGSA